LQFFTPHLEGLTWYTPSYINTMTQNHRINKLNIINYQLSTIFLLIVLFFTKLHGAKIYFFD